MNKYNVDEMVEELFANKDIQKEIISIMQNFNLNVDNEELTIKDRMVENIAPFVYDCVKEQQFSSEFMFCSGFFFGTKMNEVIDNYLKNKFEGINS